MSDKRQKLFRGQSQKSRKRVKTSQEHEDKVNTLNKTKNNLEATIKDVSMLYIRGHRFVFSYRGGVVQTLS